MRDAMNRKTGDRYLQVQLSVYNFIARLCDSQCMGHASTERRVPHGFVILSFSKFGVISSTTSANSTGTRAAAQIRRKRGLARHGSFAA